MDIQIYPKISEKSRTEDTTVYSLHIASSLVFFDSHFPGFPVVPGVSQIQWVIKLLPSSYGSFGGINKLKFNRPIYPNCDIILHIKKNKNNKTANFRYYDSDGNFSSGQIFFNSDVI